MNLKMQQFIFLVISTLISLTLSQAPVYSKPYARIGLQPNKAPLKLDQTHKEEVTESSLRPRQEEFLEVTTEPESEQINVAKFTHKTEKLEIDVKDDVQSEIEDLNEQGAYYIVHPNGLFQKVVYETVDEPAFMQVSTEIKYKNIAPIVEPIYTYDPRTFVFQRLILQQSI